MGRGLTLCAAMLLFTTMAFGVADAQDADDAAATCSEPYSPVATRRGYPFNDPLPDLGDEVPVERIIPTRSLNADGSATIVAQGTFSEEVIVERPQGELRITAGGQDIDAYSAGDLDGDGNSEIWVFDQNGEITASWVVPFATAAGTHSVDTAGIAVPPAFSFGGIAGEGPGQNVVAVIGSADLTDNETHLLSGTQILAAGPGGDATGIDPLAEYEGAPLGIARFRGGDQFVTAQMGQEVLRVASSGPTDATRFTTAPDPLFSNSFYDIGQIFAFQGPAGRFLMLPQTSRSGGFNYIWSYDDPCTTLHSDDSAPTDSTPPAVEPAAPTGSDVAGVPAPLSFTG